MASERQCESCGEANPAGSSFCLFCGTYLGWDQPGAEPAATQQAPAPGPAPPGPATPGPSAVPDEPPPAAAPTESARRRPDEASPAPSSRPTDSATTPTTAAPGAQAGASGPRCPSCGHANAASRRFCERCGFTLVAMAAAPAASSRGQSSGGGWWWSRSSEDRAARRAYRRSLPPLYRWRRVIVSILVVVLALVVITVVEGNPVDWGKARYYDLRDQTVEVEDVSASTRPGGADATDAVDGRPTTYWDSPWQAGSPPLTSCSDAAVSLQLTWPETVRVRGLRVGAGLRADDEARLARPQPTSLLVSWPSAGSEPSCVTVALKDQPQVQDVRFDTETETDTLWVAIGSVDEPENVTEERPAALRDVAVLRRP